MPNELYLIDTFSLVFQVFHAIPPMTGPKGQPTNAVFGFTRDLKSLLEERQPSHIVCAMESEGPGKRSEIYAEYKANRTEMPEDLRPQIAMILDVVRGFNVSIVESAGWEADDVIATLTTRAVAAGFDVCLISSDKDLRQLLGPNVRMFNCRTGAFYDESDLLADWGIRPEQVVDFQSLTGDSVDNVPGVPLVGPKKAQSLLEEFGTLEEVLANADKARGPKLRENLKTFADQARMSRELVRLKVDLPLEFEWDDCATSEPDRPRLVELFTDYGFGRLTTEMREVQSGDHGGAAPGSGRLFSNDEPEEDSAPQPDDLADRTWELVDTTEKFDAFLEEFKGQTRFCVDLETTGLDAMQAEIVGWAFCWEAGRGWYLPVMGPPDQTVLDAGTVLDALRPMLEDPEIEVVNQNLKYDMLVLKRAGVELAGVGMDPMIADYLLDAGARSHGLNDLSQRCLGHKMIPISELIGKGKQQRKMYEIDVATVAQYASEDADAAWRLADLLGKRLKSEGLWDLYWDLERPLISVLCEMEHKGIRVDANELTRQSEELDGRLEQTVAEIYELAGREFNIASPIQLREILFEELKLPVVRRTKTGASTNQDVLERLALQHPLPAKIIDHRGLAKLKGTYLDALPKLIDPDTGNIHTSFNQVAASTGRLSSTDPNLQNIPIRTQEGRQVRRAFTASRPGWKLVCADYSQVELRLLAHFSNDEALRTAFEEGADIHTAVASDIFTVDPRDVDSDQRRVAKAVNFGVIYGQSPFGLAAALGISKEDAAEFIDNYFARYAGVERYMDELLAECRKTGYSRTILNRRRPIEGIRPRPNLQRNMAERTAINMVIQGSAADLIKRAMIQIHNRLDDEQHPARMLLQIHDELVFEAPVEEVESLVGLAREEMSSALDLSVPLVVDVKAGENWLDAEPVSF